MSQRFSLFYAGYTSYIPALYFNQLAFIESINDEENEALEKCLSDIRVTVNNSELEAFSHIKTAASLAEYFKVPVQESPQHFVEYFDWLHGYIESVEAQFPMSRMDHYYFLYARKIAEITCNVGLLKTYLRVYVSLDKQLDLSVKCEKCLKDIEFIFFKLMAAAALLSSEPRQNYFNSYYREMSENFAKFKNMDVTELNSEKLDILNAELSAFELCVTNGFKKCIGLLKELGI